MSKLLVHMTEKELVEVIRSAVNMELNGQTNDNSEEDQEELTRQEAAKLLGVTVGTIDNWSKRGILTKYARGSRRYFVKDEILKSKKEMIYKNLN